MVEITQQQFEQYQTLLNASGQQKPLTKTEREIEKVKNNPYITEQRKHWVIAKLKDEQARNLKAEQKKERNRKIDSLKIKLRAQAQIIESINYILQDCSGLGTIQRFEFLVFQSHKISLSQFKRVLNGFDTRDCSGRIYFQYGDVYFVNHSELESAVISCLNTLKNEIEKHTAMQNKIQAELDALLKE